MIFVFIAMLLVAIFCRYTIDWSEYFDNFCLLANGTLLPIANRTTADLSNCTRVLP